MLQEALREVCGEEGSGQDASELQEISARRQRLQQLAAEREALLLAEVAIKQQLPSMLLRRRGNYRS